jgi:hypothetical protein
MGVENATDCPGGGDFRQQRFTFRRAAITIDRALRLATRTAR